VSKSLNLSLSSHCSGTIQKPDHIETSFATNVAFTFKKRDLILSTPNNQATTLISQIGHSSLEVIEVEEPNMT
jgi:hypothetical protein